jgi:hypothetical protein
VRALFLKWLWNELTRIEFMFLFDTPEFHSSPYMCACVNIASKLGKKEVRKRIEWIHNFLGVNPNLSHSAYIGSHSLRILISQEINELPRTPKYTGWARHQRVAKGSKGSTTPLSWTLLTEPDTVDIFSLHSEFLLLLEDFALFQGRAKILLKSPKVRTKTE